MLVDSSFTDDSQYHEAAEALIMALEEQLDDCVVDIDYESAEGILTLIFLDKSRIIINKQEPLHQVWVATKFNGHHFAFDGQQWIDQRFGEEFWTFIDQAISKQAGQELTFRPEA